MSKTKENSKEKSVVESIKKMPQLWMKCPRCHELLFAKEVAKLNCCPKETCGYVFPYPVAKALKIETLLKNPKTTYGELSELILETLGSIDNQDKKVAFLNTAIGLIQEYHERRLMQRKQ